MKIQSIFKNDYHITYKTNILNFCKQAFEEKFEPSHVNMWHEDWENVNSTLPYLLYKSTRFANNNGDMFMILDDNDNILGLSGINISEFDNNVALGGVRTWLNKDMRGKFVIGRNLLPVQLRWAKEHGLKTIALTFNDYNKRLIPYFKRSGFGIKKERNPDSMFYNGQFHVDFPITINHTKQWVIYHKIDESYQPNWESIRFIENK
jgi:N-acetylglutamate synthase-like GNAT family acetyltransferase